jgi:hypothetical protein
LHDWRADGAVFDEDNLVSRADLKPIEAVLKTWDPPPCTPSRRAIT